MNKVKEFTNNKPIFFSIITIIVSILFVSIPLDKLLAVFLPESISGYASGVIEQGTAGAILAVLTHKLGLSQTGGYNGIKSWKKVWLVWPLVLLTLLQGSNIFSPSMNFVNDPARIIFFVLVYLSTGWFEEALMRGLALPAMLKKYGHSKKGIYFAVFISGILFGISHIYSLLVGRMTVLACFNQIAYASIIGIFCAACMLRTKSIWLVMVLHGLFDVVFSLDEITVGWAPKVQTATVSNIIGALILFSPFLIYALIILRKVE